MSPRPRTVEDDDVFAALVRVMHRRGPAELTVREIAAEAGVTAGALIQRFGSKRALLLAHARHAATTGDIGVTTSRARAVRPPAALDALRAVTDVYASLARSPRAALRNLAYLHNDLGDPVLHRRLLQSSRLARTHYEGLVSSAIAAKQLRSDTDAVALARAIEVTLRGSFLAWTVYRVGAAAVWLRQDLDATLRPYLVRRTRKASGR